jgi:flavin reductase (DIM6/NTAB) family NADH-FMN oxidoreductase RutF
MKVKKNFPLSKAYQLIEPGPVVMVTTAHKQKANIMTMAWHMMVDFVPPFIGCVISEANYSFKLLQETHECVINVPTVDLIERVVGVGSTTGSEIDKFKTFNFSAEPCLKVSVPMIKECFANLECKVVDTALVKKYNIFILEVVHAWILPFKKRPRTFHHWGKGVFTVDEGTVIHLPFETKK